MMSRESYSQRTPPSSEMMLRHGWSTLTLSTRSVLRRPARHAGARWRHLSLTERLRGLEDHLGSMTGRPPESAVNGVRARVLQNVRVSLQVCSRSWSPLSAENTPILAITLDNALEHGLSRVIYVIPK